jgi:hypothetical protein
MVLVVSIPASELKNYRERAKSIWEFVETTRSRVEGSMR